MKTLTYTIQKIIPKSIALVGAAISAVVGVISGIMIYVSYAVFQMNSSSTGGGGDATTPSVEPGTPSLPALLLIPIMYGLFGYFVGYIGAIIYNFLAGKGKGIVVEMSEK